MSFLRKPCTAWCTGRKQESRIPGENRDPVFKIVPGFLQDDVWIPGRVSLARNDDSTSAELSIPGFREADPAFGGTPLPEMNARKTSLITFAKLYRAINAS